MYELKDVLAIFLQIFPRLSEELLERLSEIIKEKSLKKGEFALKPPQINKHIFFIRKGLLRSFSMEDETDVSSWFMKEGDFVVSILSFYDQVPSDEFIQAMEPTELYYISYAELEDTFKNYLEFNFVGRILEIEYLKQTAKQLRSLRMRKAEERYEWLLENYPELIQRVPSKYLASYLDLTASTFSKMKKEVQKKKRKKP